MVSHGAIAMPGMTNPMDALIALQVAIDQKRIELEPCYIHRELRFIADEPGGRLRLTYASIRAGQVQSISSFVLVDPVEGIPCFQIGCAVVESKRRQGLGSEIVAKGIEELHSGFKRQGIPKLYVEAFVEVSNTASNRLARRVLSDPRSSGVDAFSGDPALQYLKLVE